MFLLSLVVGGGISLVGVVGDQVLRRIVMLVMVVAAITVVDVVAVLACDAVGEANIVFFVVGSTHSLAGSTGCVDVRAQANTL